MEKDEKRLSTERERQVRMIRVVKTAYDHIIAQRKREIAFWILATFLPTFLVARTVVYLRIPIFINVHGVHIHHLAFGIIVLAIAGYFALTVQKT